MTGELSPEEREEAQRISRAEAAGEARALLRHVKHGVLGTLSRRHDGWPFGSIVPYALDRTGAPLILIASIAEHTRNIAADDRVSLLVHEDAVPGTDVQARGRLTILGRAETLPEAELDDAAARYLARVPSAADYFATHDFGFRRIQAMKHRFIGGFGSIFWLEPGELSFDPALDPLAKIAAGVIDHMNTDHADALLLLCKVHRGITPASVRMTGVDQWGLDLCTGAPEARVRVDFRQPATAATIRERVVELVREARAAG